MSDNSKDATAILAHDLEGFRVWLGDPMCLGRASQLWEFVVEGNLPLVEDRTERTLGQDTSLRTGHTRCFPQECVTSSGF